MEPLIYYSGFRYYLPHMDPVAKTLAEFSLLKCALIDTSSLIYMRKCGFYKIPATVIKIYSIREVLEELYSPVSARKVTGVKEGKSTDEKLICTAAAAGYPIISEDRAVLKGAGKRGLPYFNALMILNFLLYKNRINPGEYQLYSGRLFSIARYSRRVKEYGAKIYSAICHGK